MSVGSPVMEKTNAIRVVIIEDYKLTRVGLSAYLKPTLVSLLLKIINSQELV